VRPEIVQRINAEVAKFMHTPEVHKHLAASGLIPSTNTPAEFSSFVRADLEKWSRVIREAKITVQ
jgi:tripartite-type tricarboxylate transporter receptor subunit TctC